MEAKTRYLPHDLRIEILLRLPVKSLLRFKCVHKSWFSLMADPHFTKSHFQLSHTHRFMCLLCPPKLRSIDFEAFLNDDPNAASPNIDVWLPGCNFRPHIRGSCGGLIYLYQYPDICLWNPSTRFKKQISVSPFDSKLVNYYWLHLHGFGYDQSRDDYLIVVLTHDPTVADVVSSHLEFFSFRDNTWKEIEGTLLPYMNEHDPYMDKRNHGLLFNGAIHWLAMRNDLGSTVILAFDLKERKLLEISLPHDFKHHTPTDLWVFGECLSFWVMDYTNCTTEIWVMNKYNVHTSWTKTLVLSLVDTNFIPRCSTKNGDIFGIDRDLDMVKYNDKGRLLGHRQYSGVPAYDVVMYTESLISLPGDNE